MISQTVIENAFPSAKHATAAEWALHLSVAMSEFHISTDDEIAWFLAQIGHESAGLTRLVENLSYTSAARIKKVWPNIFSTEEDAAGYVGVPIALGNRVYAGRLGNGNEASGDGYRYRGRGLIQLTGKANYAVATKGLSYFLRGASLVETPDLLSSPGMAALSAGFFWEKKGLNTVVANTMRGVKVPPENNQITRTINGGYNGAADRLKGFLAICALLERFG